MRPSVRTSLCRFVGLFFHRTSQKLMPPGSTNLTYSLDMVHHESWKSIHFWDQRVKGQDYTAQKNACIGLRKEANIDVCCSSFPCRAANTADRWFSVCGVFHSQSRRGSQPAGECWLLLVLHYFCVIACQNKLKHVAV